MTKLNHLFSKNPSARHSEELQTAKAILHIVDENDFITKDDKNI